MTSKLLQTAALLITAPFLLAGSVIGLILIVIGQTAQSIRKVWR